MSNKVHLGLLLGYTTSLQGGIGAGSWEEMVMNAVGDSENLSVCLSVYDVFYSFYLLSFTLSLQGGMGAGSWEEMVMNAVGDSENLSVCLCMMCSIFRVVWEQGAGRRW